MSQTVCTYQEDLRCDWARRLSKCTVETPHRKQKKKRWKT